MSETALNALYGILAAGAAGLYLGLPSARPDARRLRVGGAIFGTAATAGVAVYLARWIGPGFEGRTFFVIFAALGVIAAARVVTHPRPVYSAVYFILVVLASTGLCILAAAEFLAAALLIIYGGAILVTYIFVIMLAQQAGQSAYDQHAREPLAAVLMGFLLVAATTQALVARDPIATQARAPRGAYRHAVGRVADGAVRQVADDSSRQLGGRGIQRRDAGATSAGEREDAPGNTWMVGQVLMTKYVMAVEVAGVLLLVAVVGAIAIARKRIEPEAMTPEERRQLEKQEDLHQRGRQVAPF